MALVLCFALPLISNAQCLLYEVSLAERSSSATLIAEARILDQQCFRHSDKLIYTRSRLQVNAVLKGNLPAGDIYLITPGGRIGDQMIRVEPSLEANSGQTGLFFLQASRVADQKFAQSSQFEPFASVQGFVEYNPLDGQLRDPFHSYDSREALFSEVSALTGLRPRILDNQDWEIHDHSHGGSHKAMSVIASFTPATQTAGTQSTITINGNNFEAYDGGTNSTVFFANADDGGATFTAAPASEVVSWNNTQIVVRVPSGAGTGTFIVRNASGVTGGSGSALTVPYNHTNVTSSGNRFPTHLTNDNGSGGYTLVLSTNTANAGVNFSTSAGLAPFSRALDTWVCSTGFNTVISGTTTSTTVDPNDALNIVMFDNAAAPLPAGVLGRATSGYGSCTGTSWFVNGFDIQFRRDGTGGVTWNFGTAPTAICCFDFESVAVHELGHAHQLGHIISAGRVMHFGLANGSDARNLNATSDIAGGNFVMAQSNGYTACFGGVSGMTGAVCIPLAIEFQGISGELTSNQDASLQWQFEGSDNVLSLDIMRSADATLWTKEGSLDPNLVSAKENVYAWIDQDFSGEKQFYQVRALLTTGETLHSGIVEILSTGADWNPSVYPNPFSHNLRIAHLPADVPSQVEIYSTDGRKLHEQQVKSSALELNSTLLSNLPQGLYILRLSTGSNQQHFRIVKD